MDIVQELEKRKKLLRILHSPSNSEVYTPPELVEQMLDKLPEDVWRNPDLTWVDPCAKSGVFILEVIIRLMKNLPIKDETFRYNHIINNMVRAYVNEERNKWVVSKMIYGDTKKVNRVGILEINKLKEENMPKFDVVVGNPPYQLGKDKLFYMKFIKLAYEISNKYVLFITPAAIFTTNVKFYEDKKNKFEYINLDPKTHEYFKVGLGTLFSYYVIDKNKNDFEVTVNFGDNEQQLNLKKLKYNILDKRNYDLIFDSIMSKYYLKGIKKRFKGKGDLINKIEDAGHIFKKEKTKDFQYPAYLSSKHDRKNVFSRKPGEGYGISKLVVTDIMEPNRAERFSEFNKDKSVGRYSNYFKVNNEKEAKNIQNFFNSDLYKFLDKKNRSGRYAFLNIPDIDYSKLWTDQELYEYFDLTQEEIDYIETQVK